MTRNVPRQEDLFSAIEPPRSVLCIEDDIGLARLIQRRLERAKWEVRIAHSAAQGLEIYEAARPQIVTVDYALPDSNGIEVLGVLRRQNGTEPEVIIVTGAGDEQLAVRAMREGARDYLIKDVGGQFLDLLPAVLTRALEQRRTEIQKRSAEQALRVSEKSLRTIIENAPEAIVVLDTETGCFVNANENAERLFGVDREGLMKLGPIDLSPSIQPGGKDSAEMAARYINAAATGDTPTFDWVHTDIHGREIYCEVRLVQFPSAGKKLVRGSITDITERKRIEEALFKEKERAQVTLRSIGDAVISTNARGRVDFLNPVAETLTGWPAAEAEGRLLKDVFQIIDEQSREPMDDPVLRCIDGAESAAIPDHAVLVSRLGKEYAIEDSVAPIRGRNDELLGVVLVFKDVTTARSLSRKVSYRATHDTLTGLINRGEFEHRLGRVLDTSRREDTKNALCYLDFDQFKLVNDTCGHVAGDELLRQLGRLLSAQIRKGDTLARLGGDEFGLLMEHCSLEEARRVADSTIEVIGDFVFVWEEHSFSIGVSIGLVAVDKNSVNIVGLLSDADNACYMAKKQGGNRVHLQYDDDDLARRHGEAQWAVRLPRALSEERFQLFYQEIVRIDGGGDGQSERYELLLRMEDESKNLVSPDVFLPAAERYDLADEIDRWVTSRALKWLSDCPSHLQKLALCSINLSAPALSDNTFLPFVAQELKGSGIAPEKICFEISETVAIANLSAATDFIIGLKGLGCHFALDDFGSGLSSFAFLKNLPVDYLKIAGVFVKDILHDPIDQAMVKSINEIGHVMGKQTIAEFVENDEILQKLREIGVDYAQGFGVSRPRPLADLLKT